jgi:long-chain fatty acid transport protein
VAVGGDYRLSDTVTLRAGAQHDETPTQNTQRDARVPDSDRWNYAVGASIRLKPRLTLDAAVNYVRFAGSSIDRLAAAYVGTPAQTPIIVDGYSRNTSVLVLAVGARIGF